MSDIYEDLATCHPKLTRGRVWCTQCGNAQRVDVAHSFAHGWPKCCGYTMTIDSPQERSALRALTQDKKEGGE